MPLAQCQRLMTHALTARLTLLRGHTLLDITHSQLAFGQKDHPLDQKHAAIFTSETPKGVEKTGRSNHEACMYNVIQAHVQLRLSDPRKNKRQSLLATHYPSASSASCYTYSVISSSFTPSSGTTDGSESSTPYLIIILVTTNPRRNTFST